MEAVIEHLPVLTVAISLLGAFTVVLTSIFTKRAGYPLSMGIVTLQLLMSISIFRYVTANGVISYWLGGWRPPWGIEYRVDTLGAYMLLVVTFFSFFSTIYARRIVEREIDSSKHPYFYTLWLLLISGMVGVAVTGDLFNLFVFLEIASLATYALIAMAGRKALIASFNYLVLGAVGISFYLLGTAFLYSATGTLNMYDARSLLTLLYTNRIVQLSFVFYFIGLAMKMALFPFHIWQPNAYDYSPSAVTVIMSTALAKINAYALFRLIFFVFTAEFFLHHRLILDVTAFVASVGIIAGSIFAIMEKSLKKMLAYSSVANIGYIVLAFTLGKWGVYAAASHLLNHSLMKAALFMVAGGFIYKLGARNIEDLEGLGKAMPLSSAAFTMSAVSMIGIPPSAGFVTKLFILFASLETGRFVFIAVMIASSLLSLVYFWRVIEMLYMKGHRARMEELPPSMLYPALLMGVLSISAGILWFFNIDLLQQIALSLGVK